MELETVTKFEMMWTRMEAGSSTPTQKKDNVLNSTSIKQSVSLDQRVNATQFF